MADPTHLRPEDRPDFESILRLAVSSAGIRKSLLADPSGQAAIRARKGALDSADEITVATGTEYALYVALRAAARRGTSRPSTSHGTLLSALAVLTPVIAAVSAAALLLLGYTLQLAGTAGDLPRSLVTVGWVLTLVAAPSTLVALAALLRTALRERREPPTAERVEQARLSWHQALLDRGMVPHLRQYLAEEQLPGTAETCPAPTRARPTDRPAR